MADEPFKSRMTAGDISCLCDPITVEALGRGSIQIIEGQRDYSFMVMSEKEKIVEKFPIPKENEDEHNHYALFNNALKLTGLYVTRLVEFPNSYTELTGNIFRENNFSRKSII
jgi:hypothetical protein